MPPLVTEQHTGAWSTLALCWARQESGALIGTRGQRLLTLNPNERYDQKNNGFFALKLIPAGYPALKKRDGPPRKAARPAVYQPSDGAQVASLQSPILR
jgi:hypothetical protein